MLQMHFVFICISCNVTRQHVLLASASWMPIWNAGLYKSQAQDDDEKWLNGIIELFSEILLVCKISGVPLNLSGCYFCQSHCKSHSYSVAQDRGKLFETSYDTIHVIFSKTQLHSFVRFRVEFSLNPNADIGDRTLGSKRFIGSDVFRWRFGREALEVSARQANKTSICSGAKTQEHRMNLEITVSSWHSVVTVRDGIHTHSDPFRPMWCEYLLLISE